ncbi:hypothetical protein [uncultured Shewanella sp.]|uniref:hypothetical protein n=1 Tax=uncultured Shewanella sp. TaxID=173975 RepID=UPI002610516B|nr:hypothetical protein [uncultured Shewanella sp.]
MKYLAIIPLILVLFSTSSMAVQTEKIVNTQQPLLIQNQGDLIINSTTQYTKGPCPAPLSC